VFVPGARRPGDRGDPRHPLAAPTRDRFPSSLCTVHETESVDTERCTRTFRHNVRIPGTDFFD
jgi:hypothetical protein